MPEITIRGSSGASIVDWRRWERPASPDRHWRCGRSAMELARAWFRSPAPVVPAEITELFRSHPLTARLHITSGCPEARTPLPPDGSSGPRCHDLLLNGLVEDHLSKTTICVEAKVDEPFGEDIVGDYWNSKLGHRTSDVCPRIRALLDIVFGAAADPNAPPWRDLAYQLLTAVAGTLLQAARDGSDLAVFIVHEFDHSDHCATISRVRLEENHQAFETLVHLLPGLANTAVQPGRLLGPVAFAESEHLSKPLELLLGRADYVW